MKRGAIRKREFDGALVLERRMLGTCNVLALDRNRCIGCNICVKICPEEAPRLLSAVIRDGKLLKMGFIDIDAGKCTLCGECVVLCPANAIEIMRNGKEIIPVIEAGVFPDLLKEIVVDVGRCNLDCELACRESCPTKAISITTEKAESGDMIRIIEVDIDRDKCIFCGKCESACPQTAIHVVRPFQGLVQLKTDLCSDNCQACVDVCPSKALILYENGKPRIEERFCIYCGACQEVCPEKAIGIQRTRILHNLIKSGAWITALEKLMSLQYLDKELSAKSMKKLREAVRNIDRF